MDRYRRLVRLDQHARPTSNEQRRRAWQQFLYIRETGIEPDPWDIGAIEAILPELANFDSDWSKSLTEFSREEMIAFLGDAYNLIGKAMLARDKGEHLVTRKGPPGTAETRAGRPAAVLGKFCHARPEPHRTIRLAREHRASMRCSRQARVRSGSQPAATSAHRRSDPSACGKFNTIGCATSSTRCRRAIGFRAGIFSSSCRASISPAPSSNSPKRIRLKFDGARRDAERPCRRDLRRRAETPDVTYPCLWEHKGLNTKGFKAIERDGLRKAYPQYAVQVALYQHFLGVDGNPAIFTVMNADSCERLHILVPYDAEFARRLGSSAPKSSSRQRAPANCCRASPTTPITIAAGFADIRRGAGGHEHREDRQAYQDAVVIERRRGGRRRARHHAHAGQEGADIHELAERVEGRKLSQAEMQQIYDQAYRDGKDAAAADAGFRVADTAVVPRHGVRDPAQGQWPPDARRSKLRRRHGAVVRPPRAVRETSEMAACNLLPNRTAPMIEKPQKRVQRQPDKPPGRARAADLATAMGRVVVGTAQRQMDEAAQSGARPEPRCEIE